MRGAIGVGPHRFLPFVKDCINGRLLLYGSHVISGRVRVSRSTISFIGRFTGTFVVKGVYLGDGNVCTMFVYGLFNGTFNFFKVFQMVRHGVTATFYGDGNDL